MDIDNIRKTCWEKAYHAYATSYIFEQRANLYGRRLKFLTFLGIVVPLAIGTIYLSFGPSIPGWLLTIAGILGLVQIIGSALSLSFKWDDYFAYAKESITVNRQQSNEYRNLAQSSDTDNLNIRFQILEASSQARDALDDQQGVTDEERRMGHRATLRKFQKQCVNCKQKPMSMDPSECPVCGNFKRRKL